MREGRGVEGGWRGGESVEMERVENRRRGIWGEVRDWVLFV